MTLKNFTIFILQLVNCKYMILQLLPQVLQKPKQKSFKKPFMQRKRGNMLCKDAMLHKNLEDLSKFPANLNSSKKICVSGETKRK